MTLFKQLATMVTLVFILIVASTTISDIRRSGVFIEGQLKVTAKDMATVLGLAISNSPSSVDVNTYETLFNAVFDSGYYSRIDLIGMDGKLIFKKEREIEIHTVPNWFVSMVSLTSATGQTRVMNGWVPLGYLNLTLHPGYVYSSLYQNLKVSLFWLVVLFSLGLCVLWIVLHHVLKPLILVKQQADAIHKNIFVKQEEVPRTLELRSVVEAMNRMIDKVHVVFDEQELTLTRYTKLLYQDTLTGLFNRQYYISELESSLREDASFNGSFVVIQVHNLDRLSDKHGYEMADRVLKGLANILKSDSEQQLCGHCSRISPCEFAIIIPNTGVKVIDYVQDIFSRFKSKNISDDIADDISLMAGATDIQESDTVTKTLSTLDFALSQAISKGPYSIHQESAQSYDLPEGKIQWKKWLEDALQHNSFFLVKQNIHDSDDNIIHQEVFVRLKNSSGDVISAGLFMPMANELGLSVHIDATVFSLVKKLCNKDNEIPIALNLTESVFTHADDLLEFNQLISFFKTAGRQLCVEVSHIIVERHPAMCAEVAATVKSAGHLFGIDNFNFGRSLKILQTVHPNYLKINSQTLCDMSAGTNALAFEALCSLANTMEFKLYAVGVSTNDSFEKLKRLGIDGLQGNLINKVGLFE